MEKSLQAIDKGETDYELTFLTKDSVDDVMSFYKDQFKKQNWTVDDSSDKNQGFTVAIDFNDSTKATTGTRQRRPLHQGLVLHRGGHQRGPDAGRLR